ncbi:DUF6157 family protein [Cohnella algarum]|uniref:DUF6157 family protein n=1 Tax=Cohnella algarum TaxID=2044859 RepID=UPI001F076F02|nr:DUF6157 family protein [Cohnella algarum]
MSYKDTLILISEDCPAEAGIVPQSAKETKPAHVIQYELLSANPYRFTHEELLFEVHVRHKGIPEDKAAADRRLIWDELFGKSHPCLRASMLPKKFGWGVHYDAEGRIALYGAESPEYQNWLENEGKEGNPKLLRAMRNKRK